MNRRIARKIMKTIGTQSQQRYPKGLIYKAADTLRKESIKRLQRVVQKLSFGK